MAPPGYISYQREFNKINDVFKTNFELLMSTPVYSNDEPDNHEIIAEIYTLERLIMSHIGAHGSMYKFDKKRDSGHGTYGGRLNSENFKSEVTDKVPLENQKDYCTDWADHVIDWVTKYNWANDYQSYKFIHNMLSKHSGRFHGIGAKAVSPYKGHQAHFFARSLKGVLSGTLGTYFYNLKRIKTAIENKIAQQKFNVIELQGGYLWVKQDTRWFLQLEIWMTSRYGNEIADIRNGLELKFANTLRFHSDAITLGQDTFRSILSMTDSNQSQIRILSDPSSCDSLSLHNLNLDVSKIQPSSSQVVTRSRFKTSTQKGNPEMTDKTPTLAGPTNETDKENDSSVQFVSESIPESSDKKSTKRKLNMDSNQIDPKKSKKGQQPTFTQSTLTQFNPKTKTKPVGKTDNVRSAFTRPKNLESNKDAEKENESRFRQNKRHLDRICKKTPTKRPKYNITDSDEEV